MQERDDEGQEIADFQFASLGNEDRYKPEYIEREAVLILNHFNTKRGRKAIEKKHSRILSPEDYKILQRWGLK